MEQKQIESLINELAFSVYNEFNYLYYNKNMKDIYATVLMLDDDYISAFLVISTYKSLVKEHRGVKWEPNEWVFGSEENVDNGLDSFSEKMLDIFLNDIQPKVIKGFDYDIQKNINLNIYIEGLKKAKGLLIDEIGESVNDIVFYLNVLGDEEIENYSAKKINMLNDSLNKFLNRE